MNFAITCILQRLHDLDVFGVSHENLISEIEKYNPNVLIFEIEKNEKKNVQFLVQIRTKFPKLKTLILIDSKDKEFIIPLLKYNFEGFLLKNTSQDDLIFATKRINKGKNFYDPNISEFVMANLGKNNKSEKNSENEISEREKEILKFIVLGKKNEEIADTLNISKNTVLTHRRNIMRKLLVKSTPQLIAKTLQKGIISFPAVN